MATLAEADRGGNAGLGGRGADSGCGPEGLRRNLPVPRAVRGEGWIDRPPVAAREWPNPRREAEPIRSLFE